MLQLTHEMAEHAQECCILPPCSAVLRAVCMQLLDSLDKSKLYVLHRLLTLFSSTRRKTAPKDHNLVFNL